MFFLKFLSTNDIQRHKKLLNIIILYIISCLGFITHNQCLYSAVRAKAFNLMPINFGPAKVGVNGYTLHERQDTGLNIGPSYDQKTPQGD